MVISPRCGTRAFGIVLFLVVFTALALGGPGKTGDLPFDPNRVVEKVQADRGMARGQRSIGNLEPDGGEFLIDTSWVLRPRYLASSPAVSFDGTNYLVVWVDYRSGTNDIFGARVNQAGVVLDAEGVSISDASGDQRFPAVSFDGANFLVVWEDKRSGTNDIYGARVSQAGVVLDPAGIHISTATGSQECPAVSFGGTNCLVVWQDYRNGSDYDIYGARVAPAGTVLDPTGIPVSTTAYGVEHAAVSFDGTDWLVVWMDGRGSRDIYGARVSQAGTVLDPAGVPISTVPYWKATPAVSFDGTNFFVVWQDSRRSMYKDIYGARVNQAGTVIDPSGIPITTGTARPQSPAISYDGANYFVVWLDERGAYDIYGTRVSPSGTVLDTGGIHVSDAYGDESYPAVCSDGTNSFVFWNQKVGRTGYSGIYGARANRAGVILDPAGVPVSTTANRQTHPAVSFDGANFLAVWEDQRSGTSDIYGARVSQAGSILDQKGFQISTSTSTYSECYPVASSDGTNTLVVWQHGYDIYGARVSQAGSVLDPTGILVSTTAATQQNPAVSFDGSDYLVVWEDNRNGSHDIYGARVSKAGAVLDPAGIPISTSTGSQECPAMSFGGTSYLVVWQDCRNGSNYDIYGARVAPAGTVLDPTGIPVSTTAYGVDHPAVSFDGANWLIVWMDGRGSCDIYGARVNQAGMFLDPDGFAISAAPGSEQRPVVSFDASNFLVAWEDDRGDTSDIYGARVTPAAVVFQKGAIVKQEREQFCPALAHGSGSNMLLAYQGWAGTVGSKTYDADRTWGKLNPAPGVEESRRPMACGSLPTATIVHGILLLPQSLSSSPYYDACLLDAAGRRILALHAGTNDVSWLASGVYFMQVAPGDRRPAFRIAVTR